MRSSATSFRPVAICAILLLVASTSAAAQHEHVIHSFGTISGDGAHPYTALIADLAGNLYGTTGAGGTSNAGTVYELSPGAGGWAETILYSFTNGADGGYPYGSPVLDSHGNLFGTTMSGGIVGCLSSCGTVFELSPPAIQGGSWTETPIYSFSGGNDGSDPLAGLIFDQAQNIYGTTLLGGGTGSCEGVTGLGCGIVFELSPPGTAGEPWTEMVLYRFSGGVDGGSPGGGVVFDDAGNLYGTTIQGGSSCQPLGCGTVFELSPSGDNTWTETVLHSFTGADGDGEAPPAGLAVDEFGDLAGTTTYGGHAAGTVFALQPPAVTGGEWEYRVLYRFGKITNDGNDPEAGVTLAGGNAIYGTTVGGGSSANGTVFQLTRTHGGPWQESGVYSFNNGDDGKIPFAGVLLLDGALYGTTVQGGSAKAGTVFKIIP